MSSRKSDRAVFIGIIIFMLINICIVYITDPYFHYHKPFDGYPYFWVQERYQNNGITRNFEYDAIITGTSMTQNFKVSQLNALFNVNGIKVCFSGGALNEIGNNLRLGLETHNVSMVVLSLDYTGLCVDKNIIFDEKAHQFKYPYYLIDNNLFNDIEYIFNKSIMSDAYKVVNYKLINNIYIPSFDDYSNWSQYFTYGRDSVIQTFSRQELFDFTIDLSDEEKITIKDNIRQNIVDICKAYPNTDFYIFFPPYSICWWDNIRRAGRFEFWLSAEKAAAEELFTCKNVKLFSFCDDIGITANLDNYKDEAHYGEWINVEILDRMALGENQLMSENYNAYQERLRSIYGTYDYESIYEN